MRTMDVFGMCAKYTDARDHMATGLYPYFRTLEGNDGGALTCWNVPYGRSPRNTRRCACGFVPVTRKDDHNRNLCYPHYRHFLLDGYGQILYWRRLSRAYSALASGQESPAT
jgi:hypothetical protein